MKTNIQLKPERSEPAHERLAKRGVKNCATASWTAAVLCRFRTRHGDQKRQRTGAVQNLAERQRLLSVHPSPATPLQRRHSFEKSKQHFTFEQRHFGRLASAVRALCLLLFFCAALTQAGVRVQSTFDSDKEGWTQMNLTGDIRYVLAPEEFPETCPIAPPAPFGILSFCDPDAGEWVFEAPAKFLGNQSAMFGGTISWRQHHRGDSVGDPPPPGFRVVLADTNKAIAIVMTMSPPAFDQWVSNSITLDESAGWAWVDETTGQEDLPTATTAQIQEVLQSLTGFRIVGEFITGDDTGSLDDVKFFSLAEESPQLSVSRTATNTVFVSWPLSASGFTLEQTATLQGNPPPWTEIVPPYQTNATHIFITPPSPAGNKFYRLHKL